MFSRPCKMEFSSDGTQLPLCERGHCMVCTSGSLSLTPKKGFDVLWAVFYTFHFQNKLLLRYSLFNIRSRTDGTVLDSAFSQTTKKARCAFWI